MDVTPLVPASRKFIQGYGDGGFRVSEDRHEGSLIVFPDRVETWPVATVSEVTVASLDPVVAAADEVRILLLGCGPRMAPVPAALRQELRSAGIVVEPMDTGAACRTYNVLMMEDRLVAAALIAV